MKWIKINILSSMTSFILALLYTLSFLSSIYEIFVFLKSSGDYYLLIVFIIIISQLFIVLTAKEEFSIARFSIIKQIKGIDKIRKSKMASILSALLDFLIQILAFFIYVLTLANQSNSISFGRYPILIFALALFSSLIRLGNRIMVSGGTSLISLLIISSFSIFIVNNLGTGSDSIFSWVVISLVFAYVNYIYIKKVDFSDYKESFTFQKYNLILSNTRVIVFQLSIYLSLVSSDKLFQSKYLQSPLRSDDIPEYVIIFILRFISLIIIFSVLCILNNKIIFNMSSDFARNNIKLRKNKNLRDGIYISEKSDNSRILCLSTECYLIINGKFLRIDAKPKNKILKYENIKYFRNDEFWKRKSEKPILRIMRKIWRGFSSIVVFVLLILEVAFFISLGYEYKKKVDASFPNGYYTQVEFLNSYQFYIDKNEIYIENDTIFVKREKDYTNYTIDIYRNNNRVDYEEREGTPLSIVDDRNYLLVDSFSNYEEYLKKYKIPSEIKVGTDIVIYGNKNILHIEFECDGQKFIYTKLYMDRKIDITGTKYKKLIENNGIVYNYFKDEDKNYSHIIWNDSSQKYWEFLSIEGKLPTSELIKILETNLLSF